jgi:hypothetical protein
MYRCSVTEHTAAPFITRNWRNQQSHVRAHIGRGLQQVVRGIRARGHSKSEIEQSQAEAGTKGRIDPEITTRKGWNTRRKRGRKIRKSFRHEGAKKETGRQDLYENNNKNTPYCSSPQNVRSTPVSKVLSHTDLRFACAWRGKGRGKKFDYGPITYPRTAR